MASSKISILGFLIKALAIAILCFYPPDSLTPLSPTIVSKPSGNIYLLETNSYAFANFIALSISSYVYVSTP